VLAAVAAAALVFVAWRAGAWVLDDGDPDPAPGGGNRAAEEGSGLAGEAGARGGSIAAARRTGAVTISGTVIDDSTDEGVGGVEVVFRSSAGEETTTAGPDGRYRIDVPVGTYRAFVRDETVLSIGHGERVRLPVMPSADIAGAPDEALMPVVVASASVDGVDLSVARGGVVRGKVLDRAGRPIVNAVLRARSEGPRPVLGTDIAETGTDGAFELRLPAGHYAIEVSHPRFAGIQRSEEEPAGEVTVEPGEVQTATFTLTAGCVIAGRVVGPDGRPAGEGAIEEQWGDGPSDFTPSGRIAADGTFRWTTTEETEIALRAWPWKSPPSQPMSFACHDGARFEGVVLALPNRGPDLDGLLVDASGAPVALAYIDLVSLEGNPGQQERTDAQGRWSVFQLPPGRYQITAYAAGRGVVASTVEAPQAGVRLQLGGSGRIEGKTPLLASGSFELSFARCDDEAAQVKLPAERRLVTVIDHAFTVEDVPACNLELAASWRGRTSQLSVEVAAGATAHVELTVGPQRAKIVRGTVTDDAGRPVEDAEVKAIFEDAEPVLATTDAAGHYTLSTFAGAEIVVVKTIEGQEYGADAQIGITADAEQTVDLRLSILESPSEPDGEPPEDE